MSDMRYAQMATTLLSRQPRPGLAESLGDRPATVHAVEQALRGRARRRVWRNVGFSAGAAAVIAIGWGLALHTTPTLVERRLPTPLPRPTVLTATGHSGHGAGATLVRGTTAEALGQRVPLHTGDRLRARVSADLVVSLSTGTRLGLAGTGELALLRLDQVQHFDLPKGRLRADVAKLEAGQRFLISTTDSEIEVKGTSFEVTSLEGAACADGSRTRLEVFEGTVTVRRGPGQPVYVTAGSSWPANCHPGEGAAVEVPAPAPLMKPEVASHRRQLAVAPRETPAEVSAPREASPSSSSSSAAAMSASTLSQQNDLFAGALQAHRDGDTGRALRRLDELLARYPGGPLAESAAHERRKLRAERGRHSRTAE